VPRNPARKFKNDYRVLLREEVGCSSINQQKFPKNLSSL